MWQITTKKLKKILEFNKKHELEIQKKLAEFYSKNSLKENAVIPDIITFAKCMIIEEDIEVLQIPLKDDEIGALYHEINGKKYIMLNTSLNQSNNNFAMAHELFHVFFHMEGSNGETERYIEQYQDNEEDLMANAFAGNILMPKDMFVEYYLMAKEVADKQPKIRWSEEFQKKHNVDSQTKYSEITYLISVIILLMLTFKTTYRSVVVRLFELKILSQNDKIMMEMLTERMEENNLRDYIEERPNLKCFIKDLFYPAKNNDFSKLYENAKAISNRCVAAEIMDESYKEYNLSNMEALFKKIANVGN